MHHDPRDMEGAPDEVRSGDGVPPLDEQGESSSGRRREGEELVFPVVADGDDRAMRQPGAIRAEDIEPYFALQYVARLFKIAAMVVIVALTAEVIAGIALEGVSALLPLFAEVIRGVVLAAILWGVGDLTVLFIDVGHDVRAARVLLGRISARAAAEQNVPVREESRSEP
jgi:hypothetical protein